MHWIEWKQHGLFKSLYHVRNLQCHSQSPNNNHTHHITQHLVFNMNMIKKLGLLWCLFKWLNLKQCPCGLAKLTSSNALLPSESQVVCLFEQSKLQMIRPNILLVSVLKAPVLSGRLLWHLRPEIRLTYKNDDKSVFSFLLRKITISDL